MQKTGETEIQLQRASLNASRNMYASEVFGVNKQASVCNFHMRPMTLSVYVSLNLKYKKIPLFIDAIANFRGHVYVSVEKILLFHVRMHVCFTLSHAPSIHTLCVCCACICDVSIHLHLQRNFFPSVQL